MILLFSVLLMRVLTYNVHSCEGLDFRTRPARIAEILKHSKADLVALQEVRDGQAAEIGKILGFYVFFGPAGIVHGTEFGNAILSRFPIENTHLYPISVPNREPRVCVRAAIALPGNSAGKARTIQVFTVHLGLKDWERREQAERLALPAILEDSAFQNVPRILLGDFNEKTKRGPVNRILSSILTMVGARSWPAPLPIVDLDRVYFSKPWKLQSVHAYRSGSALIASDHAPLLAVLALE